MELGKIVLIKDKNKNDKLWSYCYWSEGWNFGFFIGRGWIAIKNEKITLKEYMFQIDLIKIHFGIKLTLRYD